MSGSFVQITTSDTFIIRFWRGISAGELRWRGRIEHIQSKESATFLELEGMLDFIQRFGVKMEDTIRITPEES
jgi:hypothetical protein